MVGSISFLLALGWSKATIFLLDLFAKVNRVYKSTTDVPEGTYDIIWRYKVHSLTGLHNGVHEPLDPYGRPWPEGSGAAKYAGQKVCGGNFGGVVWQLAHDREYSANELGCPSWQSSSCCTWCPAKRSNYNVREVGPAARFKTVLYQPGDSDRKVSHHPVWDIPGVTRFTHMGDMMHGGDLGTGLQLHGSSLDHLTRPDGPYESPGRAGRVRACWSDVQESYVATGVMKRIQTLTPEMIDGKSGYPCLSIKASECRHLMRPMLHLLERQLSDSSFDGHIIEAYRSIVEVNEIVTSGGMTLTDAESTSLLESYDNFLLHSNFLATKAMEGGFCAFNMPCKFHEMRHICNFGKYTNPRAHWCYSFEDFIGHIKRSGQACVAGTAMHNVPSKMVDNYLRALSLDLEAWQN